jgi:hypothetical protein
VITRKFTGVMLVIALGSLSCNLRYKMLLLDRRTLERQEGILSTDVGYKVAQATKKPIKFMSKGLQLQKKIVIFDLTSVCYKRRDTFFVRLNPFHLLIPYKIYLDFDTINCNRGPAK